MTTDRKINPPANDLLRTDVRVAELTEPGTSYSLTYVQLRLLLSEGRGGAPSRHSVISSLRHWAQAFCLFPSGGRRLLFKRATRK